MSGISGQPMEGDSEEDPPLTAEEKKAIENLIFSRSSKLERSPTVRNRCDFPFSKELWSGTERQRSISLSDDAVDPTLIPGQSVQPAQCSEQDLEPIKRKLDLSPGGNASKRDKKEDPVEALLADMRQLERMISLQNSVKNETKEFAKAVLKSMLAYNAGLMAERYAGDDSVIASKFRRRLLTIAKSEQALNDIANEEWPQGAYSATRIGRGGFKDGEVASSIILYPEHLDKDKNLAAMATNMPELRRITADLLRERGMLDITREESTAIPGLESVSMKRRYLIQGASISDPGDLRAMDVFKWAVGLLERANQGVKQFILSIPEDCDLQRVRRILECCLAGSPVAVIIRPNKKIIRPRQNTRQENKGQTITVNVSEGCSYAEIVKDLKSNVNPEECGVRIRKISPTSTGGVRLSVMETKAGGNGFLMNKIKEKVQTAGKVQENRFLDSIVLMDLDMDVEKDEVISALIRETEVKKEDLLLNDFRENRNGSKMLTVSLPRDAAARILRQKRFKVGWTHCVAKEKFDPPFCGKCQRYGHSAWECTSEKVGVRCFKCGDLGHVSRDCKDNTFKCFMCKGDQRNHRANSMACPEYRRLVEDMKRSRQNGL